MIEVLKGDAFGGALRPPKSRGISPIFRANIRANGERYRCYVKPQPDQIVCPMTGRVVANQELVSEALGYTLAKAAEFSVPDFAGIIMLDREQIPTELWPTLDGMANGHAQENYFCWFSQDMEYPSLKQKHLDGLQIEALQVRRLKRLAIKLSKNPESSKVIAFDAWTQNSDRNAGNLLDAGRDGLMLIDHGRILRFPNWVPGGLGSSPEPFANKILSFINHFTPGWSEMLPNKSAMVMAYNGFAISFRQEGENAARQVLSEFFEQVDIDAIIQLLHDLLDPPAYAKAAGLIL